MVDEIESDNDWLASELIECPNCHAQLLWLEHSPFENGYYLYCSDCPKRVDVSIYDPVFCEVERKVKDKFEGISLEGEDYFERVMPCVEEKLLPCECGGHYRFDAVRRCLHCGTHVKQGTRNIWLPNHLEDEISEEDETLYNRLIKTEHIWK